MLHLVIRKSTQKRRGVSQIIGALLMLSIVVIVGTAILLPGLSAIEDFRNVISVEDAKNDSSRESLVIEHVNFTPATPAGEITLYVRNTGSISTIVDTMTIVKIGTQDLLLNTNAINIEIFVKEVKKITKTAILPLGSGLWNDDLYNDKSYEISITTVRGNSFKIIAIPYNT